MNNTYLHIYIDKICSNISRTKMNEFLKIYFRLQLRENDAFEIGRIFSSLTHPTFFCYKQNIIFQPK
jgi:hypothetical protein